MDRSPERLLIHEPNRGASTQDEFSQALGSKAAWIEQMKRLRQDRHGRCERLAQSPEKGPAALMSSVLGIEESHEGPGVDQDHRECFLRIASCAPRRLSVEGATA